MLQVLALASLSHVHRVAHPRFDVAKPSAAQLVWLDLEVGGNFNYGIGLPNAPWAPNVSNCYGGLPAPPAARFNSTPDFAQWTSALQDMGARYSVLSASGGCGYALWPSRARFPDGVAYNYSVAQSPLLTSKDILKDYVEHMRAAGIGTGVYFQLVYDYWGGFLHGKMAPNGPTAPKLSAEQYFGVVIEQLGEIWNASDYGNHTELWFDGGMEGWSASATAKVSAMMAALQPNAMAFQGPTATAPIRWIGNENGHAAAPNFIASDSSMANGPGHLNGTLICTRIPAVNSVSHPALVVNP